MIRIRLTIAVVIATCSLATSAFAAELVVSEEPGWPQWRGPRRDGVSDEKGLLATWPEGGPKLLWKADGIGNGHSSPVVSRGSIYITGDEGEKLNIVALDLEGKIKWKTQNGQSWKKNFPGARTGCSYSDGRLYQMNSYGRLICLNAEEGHEEWSVPTLEKYGAQNITWGICESPLVIDGKVFVTPAGQEALMVALDAKTGQQIWKADALEGETPTYSSSIMIDTGKGRQIITGGSRHTFGVDAATGRMLWSYQHEIVKKVMLTPSYYQGNIVVPLSARDLAMSYALALDPDSNQVEKKWLHEIGNPIGGVVCADGNIICSSSLKPKGWVCIDAGTGRIKSRLDGVTHGSSIYADGRFYGLCSEGKMMLLEVSDNELRIVSEFDFIKGKKDVWAHPVICNGRLYLRYGDTLSCYDVRKALSKVL